PRRDDDDIRVGRLVVGVAADEARIVAVNGPGLREVERLALGDPVDDVDEHDVSELPLDRVLRDGGADVPGGHYADLRPLRHVSSPHSFAKLSVMAVPNAEHFSSAVPSTSRAKPSVLVPFSTPRHAHTEVSPPTCYQQEAT